MYVRLRCSQTSYTNDKDIDLEKAVPLKKKLGRKGPVAPLKCIGKYSPLGIR